MASCATYDTTGVILSFALSCSQDFGLINCVKGIVLEEAMQGGVTIQCTLPVQEDWVTKWISTEYAGSSKLGWRNPSPQGSPLSKANMGMMGGNFFPLSALSCHCCIHRARHFERFEVPGQEEARLHRRKEPNFPAGHKGESQLSLPCRKPLALGWTKFMTLGNISMQERHIILLSHYKSCAEI